MVEIRSITADEVPDFRLAISHGFGSDLPEDDDGNEDFQSIHDLDVTLAAIDQGTVVGTFGSYPFELTLPGGTQIPLAGTTIVTVASTHRRRGILSELMRRHFDLAREREQITAALWASEEVIYGRFGYGIATRRHQVTVPTDSAPVPAAPAGVTVRRIGEEEAAQHLPALYDRVRRCRPGMLDRPTAWWKVRHFDDLPHRRGGATARRTVLAERDGEALGYAVFRQREKWNDFRTESKVEVVELITHDDDGLRALWSHVGNIDLYPNVEWWNTPIDDPVVATIDRFRRIETAAVAGIWLRPLDVAAMLEARHYERDGALVLTVHDRFGGDNTTLRLAVDSGRASCRSTTAEPDVTLTVADLGSLMLGGGNALTLARSGRLTGDPSSVRLLHQLMATVEAPWIAEVF